ncbi:hypothetical protein ACWDPV_01740 [Gordonia sp. NPDC003504]
MDTTTTTTATMSPARLLGVAAVIALAAFGGLYLWNNDDDGKTAACSITGATMGYLATAATKGHAPPALSAAGGGAAGTYACNKALKSLRQGDSTSLLVQTDDGDYDVDVTLQDLVARQQTWNATTRAEQCRSSWSHPTLQQLCIAGTLDPVVG